MLFPYIYIYLVNNPIYSFLSILFIGLPIINNLGRSLLSFTIFRILAGLNLYVFVLILFVMLINQFLSMSAKVFFLILFTFLDLLFNL